MIFGAGGQSWEAATAVEITSMIFGAAGQFWEEETVAATAGVPGAVEPEEDPGVVETT
jgi:hypothetical protein